MQVNKSEAAKIAGVSRRTFYTHIGKKGISVTKDNDGNEKIDVSELKRVYGTEVVLKNLQMLKGSQNETSKSEAAAQAFTERSIQFEKLLLQEKLEGAKALIEQLRSERDRLVEDQKKTQEQLDKALAYATPLTKLLEDKREGEGSKQAETDSALKEVQKQLKSFEEKDAARQKRLDQRRKQREAERQALVERIAQENNRGFFGKLFKKTG